VPSSSIVAKPLREDAVLEPAAAGPRPAIEGLVEDYLAACRARGLSPKTVKLSYGYPLRGVFLPWCCRQGITDAPALTTRILERFSAELLEHGGARGQLSKDTVWTYVKAVRGFLAWAKMEGEKVDASAERSRPEETNTDRLFVSRRRSASGQYQAITESGVQQLIRELGELAGIRRRVHPHLFRHSAATYLLQRGMNSLLVAQVLGHSSLAMIQRVYAHLTPLGRAKALMQVLRPED
jgi:site-specific recombinase XerD